MFRLPFWPRHTAPDARRGRAGGVWIRRGVAALVVMTVAGGVWVRMGPLPPGLLDDDARPSVVVLDRHGERLYEARSGAGLRREAIEAGRVPALLASATLAAEDERFRWHPGIDPIAVARALWRNLRHGAISEGGSTISQQVAKMLIARDGTRRSGIRAKLFEALVALRLEHRLTKGEILALYVNLAPYGNQIQGARRAARAYFGRDLESLTPAEVAYLAALPQQPSRFNPWKRPEAARARQQRILDRMQSRGWLTADARAIARDERLQLMTEAPAMLAPHFVERVLADPAARGRTEIRTTLDATLQRTVQGIITAERAALTRHAAWNVAVAVLDNATGEWLAWEGSGDYSDTRHGGTIDGVVSPRQPGSALKPFTYAAAFERGWHPGSVLADVPSQFPTDAPGVLYSPRNYDNRFRGPLRARAALAGSENVPAVALASEIGVPAVTRILRQAGLSTLDATAAHYGLGVTLGNAEVRLDELIAAYAMLARGGERVRTRYLLDTAPSDASTPAVIERILSERSAFWITDILSDNDARAFIFGRGGSLEFPFPVAVKTGTSQSYFDNWAIGYTRDVTVGVWVGNFDRKPLRGSSGVTGAGPIFHQVMLAAVERARGGLPIGDATPVRSAPSDVSRVEICEVSGMRAGDACPVRRLEWLPTEAAASHTCEWHHASDRGLVTIYPEEYRAWARAEGLDWHTMASAFDGDAAHPTLLSSHATPAGASSPAGARRASARRGAEAGTLTIERPLGGALFLLDPTLRAEFQTVTLAARGASSPLDWFVDGTHIGTETDNAVVRWPLARGRHTIVVKDALGRSADTWIEVR